MIAMADAFSEVARTDLKDPNVILKAEIFFSAHNAYSALLKSRFIVRHGVVAIGYGGRLSFVIASDHADAIAADLNRVLDKHQSDLEMEAAAALDKAHADLLVALKELMPK